MKPSDPLREEFNRIMKDIRPKIDDLVSMAKKPDKERMNCACEHVAWLIYKKMRPQRN